VIITDTIPREFAPLAIEKEKEMKAISLFKHIQAPSTGRHFIQQMTPANASFSRVLLL
jgi:hypothetical protein